MIWILSICVYILMVHEAIKRVIYSEGPFTNRTNQLAAIGASFILAPFVLLLSIIKISTLFELEKKRKGATNENNPINL